MENSISSLTSASHSDAELQKVLVCISRSSATFPLYHMEFMELPDSRWKWKETHPLDSPRLLVQLKMHSASQKQLGLSQPQTQWVQSTSIDNQALADTGAQMDIFSIALMLRLGVDLTSLFPVRVRIFGASCGAKIDIVGGIILEIADP